MVFETVLLLMNLAIGNCNDHYFYNEGQDVRRQVREGVRHWYNIACVKKSSGQVLMHLGCNNR